MNTDKLPQETNIQSGDVVKVRDGFYDSELGVDMGGWHGRVSKLYPEEGTALIAFDSLTLLNLPSSYIEQCEEQGYSWIDYGYSLDDLCKTEARDTLSRVLTVLKDLQKRYPYSYLGEQGREINKIFLSIDPDGTMVPLDVWGTYLQQNLTFPFEAVVDEWQGRGPLRAGDKMRVSQIEMADEWYGLIIKAKHGRQQIHFPLCNLAATDKDSPNFDLIDLYRTWFANQ